MKGLIKLFVLMAVIFFVTSLFKGGDYIRLFGVRTGLGLQSLADTADSLRIEKFMEEKKHEQRQREKGIAGS